SGNLVHTVTPAAMGLATGLSSGAWEESWFRSPIAFLEDGRLRLYVQETRRQGDGLDSQFGSWVRIVSADLPGLLAAAKPDVGILRPTGRFEASAAARLRTSPTGDRILLASSTSPRRPEGVPYRPPRQGWRLEVRDGASGDDLGTLAEDQQRV